MKKETWDEFLDHRIKIKAPNSDYALKLLVKKLERLQADGYDPNEALDEALLKGWKSVYPPKSRKQEGTDDGSSKTGSN